MISLRWLLAGAAFAIASGAAAQVIVNTFAGNANTGFGGAVGNGSLVVTNNQGTQTVTFQFTRGSGVFNDGIAIYIDSDTATSFADTSGFNDQADGGRRTISGVGSSGRSTLAFPTGFRPERAISFRNDFVGLFSLASGADNSLSFIAGQLPTPGTGNSQTNYSATFSYANLGLSVGEHFTIATSYISDSGFRSTEWFGNSSLMSGTQGSNNTFTVNGVLTVVPEPAAYAAGVGALVLALALWRRRRSPIVRA